MRVLFFLEPFPVRLRPLDFGWVADRWSAAAAALRARGVAVSWLCSDELSKHRALEPLCTPSSLGFSISPPANDDAADAQWVAIMRDAHEKTWSPVVRAALDHHSPDVVLTWTINAALQRECRERKVLLIHQEQGPLRTPLVPLFFTDPRGVNGASCVQALWPELSKTEWTAKEEAQLERWVTMAYPAPRAEVRAQRRAELGLDGARRTIAVFGQVHRDSNVLMWSRVDAAIGLSCVVSRAADPSRFQVVVKHHPAEVASVVPDGVIVAPPSLPAGELIAAADVVMTINSSVALEAMLQSKPLYLFGNGPMSGVGASRDVDGSWAALASRLRSDDATLSPSEDAARKRLLWFLLLRYFRGQRSSTDADSLLELFEHWRGLMTRDASLLEYFPTSNVEQRLLEDEATLMQLSLTQLRTQLAAQAQRNAVAQQHADATASSLREALSDAHQSAAAKSGEVVALTEQLCTAHELNIAQRAELDAHREHERSQSDAIEQLRGALNALESSAGQRLVRAVKRVPGLYSSYLAAKRLL